MWKPLQYACKLASSNCNDQGPVAADSFSIKAASSPVNLHVPEVIKIAETDFRPAHVARLSGRVRMEIQGGSLDDGVVPVFSLWQL